jgi:signal peptidase I
MDPAAAIDEARAAHHEAGSRLAARLWPTVRLVVAAFLIAIALRAFIVQPFAIPSGSMSPGLEAGDFVFVDKGAYGWTTASLPVAARADGTSAVRVGARPAVPGDVIAFVGPEGRDYVKRLVATGGDRVELRGGMLLLNGMPAPCVPLAEGLCRETLPNGRSYVIRTDGRGPLADFAEITVPEGHYFLLGDNRDNSADSRLPRAAGGIGLVQDGQVIGRAARIFFSIGDEIRWSRIGKPID